MKNVVHFGAGNIGRGFIGALFARSNYHVTFVDIADPIIQALNEKGAYTVRTASDTPETYEIHNVSGINNQLHPEKVVAAIKQATFVTTAIGPKVLPFIAPLIAEGLAERLKETDDKVYVIACENQISATDFLKQEIFKALDEKAKRQLEGHVYFLNCAVDRIVPIQHNEALLDVLVESYREWIVETTEELPKVLGMETVPDLAPFIERKLFTVNTGHAVTAYLGYLAGKKKIHEALADEAIYKKVKGAVEETGAYLVERYSLDPQSHQNYIHKILNRFKNKQLDDDVTRVGRSPIRKLGPEDRLIKPAKEAAKRGLSYRYLAEAVAACLKFDADTDPEAVLLQEKLQKEGISNVLKEICGLEKNDPLAKEVVHQYEQLYHLSS
ncbi:mannitol-1-phosphate 5-dehydrogenase [Sporolactobacillus sp. THM7-7]|nr:mannitol-1-phosphate 5-dehydrogenase [Sporolactobacillus sp. THM7-7]